MTSTRKFTLFSLVFFLIFLFIGVPVAVKIAANLRALSLESTSRYFEEQLVTQQTEVLHVAEGIARDANIISAINARDIPTLDILVTHALGLAKIDFITATDREGVVLSRTIENSIRGDFLYDSTTFGYSLSQGNSVRGTEETLFYPLVAIGAVPVKNDSATVGSLVAGRVFNDGFAQEMHMKYDDTHFIFYAKNTGVVGTSFVSREVDEVLRTNLDTTIINTTDGDLPFEHIAVERNVYDVVDIPLIGTSGTIGGVLLLHERNALLENILIAVTLTILYLSVLVLYLVFNTQAGSLMRKHVQAGTVVATSIILLFISSFYTAGGVMSKAILRIEKPVYPIYNSTMKIEPANGVFSLYSKQKADIVLETGGEAINAAQVIVHYDTNKIRMNAIRTEESFCDEALFIRRDIDEREGTVTIACGKARPGFTDTIGIVATLDFTPLVPGEFAFQFDDDSQILAHDGLGTNVLRASVGASYSAVEGDVLNSLSTSTLIFSTSHPNGEQWYSDQRIAFSWRNQSADGFFYAFDQNPTTTPLQVASVATTSIEVSVEKDGIHYFHVQAVRDGIPVGRTAHYKVKIDATPPARPTVKASKTDLEPGETTRLEFESSDAVSGLQNSYYYIKFNNGIFFPMRSPVYAAFPDAGTYNITIRAFDNAGNTSDADIVITVTDNLRFLWRLFNLPASVIYYFSEDLQIPE